MTEGAKYKSGDTVTGRRYNGFVVTAVSKGWYTGYFPSNVKASCSVEEASTKLRWNWVDAWSPC